jgi:hypothetical protein
VEVFEHLPPDVVDHLPVEMIKNHHSD